MAGSAAALSARPAQGWSAKPGQQRGHWTARTVAGMCAAAHHGAAPAPSPGQVSARGSARRPGPIITSSQSRLSVVQAACKKARGPAQSAGTGGLAKRRGASARRLRSGGCAPCWVQRGAHTPHAARCGQPVGQQHLPYASTPPAGPSGPCCDTPSSARRSAEEPAARMVSRPASQWLSARKESKGSVMRRASSGCIHMRVYVMCAWVWASRRRGIISTGATAAAAASVQAQCPFWRAQQDAIRIKAGGTPATSVLRLASQQSWTGSTGSTTRPCSY